MASIQLSVTLPEDVAARVREQVASGRYASESDVICESLEVLEDRDREALVESDPALDDWLVNVALPSLDAYLADPSRALTLDQVRESLGLAKIEERPLV